jgi:putative flippase GtrA
MPEEAVRHRRSFPIYVGAGGVATASHYAVTIAAVEALSMAPLAASALGFSVGAAVKYWLNYSMAFRSRARHRRAMARFAVALGAMLALNTLLFALLQGGLGLHYVLAQALTTVLLIPPGYVIHRQWVFG